MNADLGAWGTYAVLFAMALATYPMRAGGYWLMGHVPLTPRIRRILEALPGAVVIATVLPILVRDGLPAGFAVAAALAVTALRGHEFVALVAGVAAAAGARWVGLG